MADVTEIDYTTNPPTVTERDFTVEEISQKEIDAAESTKIAKDQAAKEKAAAEARAAAIAHAKSLGFTDAMIAVMYPNLGGNNE